MRLRVQHIHKAPITKMKQVDHILNERRLLEAAGSAFCVRLMAAYQDEKDLMLLQEWVGGDPLPSVPESRDLHAWFNSMGSPGCTTSTEAPGDACLLPE